MSGLFYIALFVCLAIPVLVSRILRLHNVLPVVFVQLLIGLSIHLTGLDIWLQAHDLDLVRGRLADSLHAMGWLGIILLIAMTGADSAPRESGRQAWRFVPISIFGFISTCTLGTLVGYGLAQFYPDLVGENADRYIFSFSIGISLSVTALPVLAALLHDARLSETALGKLAVHCALLDDLWLWLGMAVILALSSSEEYQSSTIPLLIVYAFSMFIFIRPLLRRWVENRHGMKAKDRTLLAISTILLSAAATELIGVHSLLGAFVAGIVLPRDVWHEVREQIVNFSQILLLPIFFVLTGLRLHIEIGDTFFWQLAGIVTLSAVLGKLLSVAGVARLMGLNWTQSFALGSLMQCKGLMELVAINILFDAGIIGPQIFSALAVMALVSTFVTVPVTRLWLRDRRNAPDVGMGVLNRAGR